MESVENGTSLHALSLRVTSSSQSGGSDGNAYLYIIIVMSFYGVFLVGIMFGYVRSKRREISKTSLLYEEEHREWLAGQKAHNPHLWGGTQHALISSLGGNNRLTGSPLEIWGPISCALCSVEQSSVSSLCSTSDARFTIQEETDCGPAEVLEISSENSPRSTENLKVSST